MAQAKAQYYYFKIHPIYFKEHTSGIKVAYYQLFKYQCLIHAFYFHLKLRAQALLVFPFHFGKFPLILHNTQWLVTYMQCYMGSLEDLTHFLLW